LNKLTDKQAEALKLFSEHQFNLIYGGSRSGKSFIACLYLIARAAEFANSRHLMVRRYNIDIAGSLWDITIPAVLAFVGYRRGKHYTTTDKPMEVTFANGSHIVCSGLDDKARLDAVLGQEYCTAYLNEANDIAYVTMTRIMTRLSQNMPGCINRMLVDLNPAGDGHWTYKLWFKGIDPQSLRPLEEPQKYGKLQMNPSDNIGNIAANYIHDMLDPLQGDARERFLNGNYQSNNELLVFRGSDIVYWEDAAFGEWCNGRIGIVRMVGGLDVGYQDADAFCIIGYIDGDATAYVLYEYKAFRAEMADLAEGIRKGLNHIAVEYPWYNNPQMIQIYSDTNTIRYGSEGDKKKNWIELKRIYGFNTCAAFKREKAFHVELLRSRFNAGQLKIPRAGMFDDEITQIVWHKNPVDGTIEHIIDDDVYHPDIMFAILYAVNYMVSYGNSAWKAEQRLMDEKEDPGNAAIETYEKIVKDRERIESTMTDMMELLTKDNQFW
jgi:hypothetical protein